MDKNMKSTFTIENHAAARFQGAKSRGRDPEPWKDTSRDFIAEGMEEAADGKNYSEWAFIQNVEAPRHRSQVMLALLMATRAFETAHEHLSRAHELLGQTEEMENGKNEAKG